GFVGATVGSVPVRKTLLLFGLAGALAAAPAVASAQPGYFSPDCQSKRIAGTVLGGLGGGAIGAAAAAGVAVTPWAWAAAGVGALIGHAIAVQSCRDHWRRAYFDRDWGPPPPPRPRPYAYYGYGRGYYGGGYYDAGYWRAPPPPPPPPRYYYEQQRRYYDDEQYQAPPPPPPEHYAPPPEPYAPPPRG